jgi:hypothetical protein
MRVTPIAHRHPTRFGLSSYADHRSGKPSWTREGGCHLRAEDRGIEARAWLVRGRCEGLHGA